MNYTNLTLKSTMCPNGYKIFVLNTLDLTSPLASINNDGTDSEDGAVGWPHYSGKKAATLGGQAMVVMGDKGWLPGLRIVIQVV